MFAGSAGAGPGLSAGPVVATGARPAGAPPSQGTRDPNSKFSDDEVPSAFEPSSVVQFCRYPYLYFLPHLSLSLSPFSYCICLSLCLPVVLCRDLQITIIIAIIPLMLCLPSNIVQRVSIVTIVALVKKIH